MEGAPANHSRWPRLAFQTGLCLGTAAAAYYAWLGLTLAHFDAKGHLIVARRIIDSLTPGWVQIGALWLPLPHLLNLLPTQVDVLYRTGAFAVAVSVASFAVAAWGITALILHATGSRLAAILGLAVFGLNPNVLYLQATPMTEPLLWGLVCSGLALSARALRSGHPSEMAKAGLVLMAAVLTRYEGWFACAAGLAVGALAQVRAGDPWRQTLERTVRLALFPLAGILAFVLLSRATVGEWFVSSGFFVPEPELLKQPVLAAAAVSKGLTQLTSEPLTWLGVAGLAAGLGAAALRAPLASAAVPVSVAAMGLLPWAAFYQGHVYRVRYMTTLIPAVAIGTGLLVGLCRGKWRWLAAALLVLSLHDGPKAFDATAPMPTEAQWDHELKAGRGTVTTYLTAHWDRTPIMASMGSLGHYMHETSAAGFRVKDFLHEGNGDIWLAALEYPDPIVNWILIEESARGGDMLAAIARRRPSFLAGYMRVAEGGGVALYRRRP